MNVLLRGWVCSASASVWLTAGRKHVHGTARCAHVLSVTCLDPVLRQSAILPCCAGWHVGLSICIDSRSGLAKHLCVLSLYNSAWASGHRGTCL